MKPKLFIWRGINWQVQIYDFGTEVAIGRCPKNRCSCRLQPISGKAPDIDLKYSYECINCDFSIKLAKPIENLGADFIEVMNARDFIDAEIVNIDGDQIRVARKKDTDDDYWVDAKISKNNKGEVQLMVLAGSKKSGNKAQLFLYPNTERYSFDQNNDHPTDVFSVVEATFKKSVVEITNKSTIEK